MDFTTKKTRVLVATDVISRGIDIKDINLVINYDVPKNPADYVHRIGRTGRAGNSGIAISFCAKDEVVYLKEIEKLIRNKAKVITDHPYPFNEEVVNEDAKPDLRNKNKNNRVL